MASVQPLATPVDREPVSSHRQLGAAASSITVSSGTGDFKMMSCSGSVVLPAGMINPSVPIRNIKTKFAVLIGLIQVGEVSNRDIVETVLNLLVASDGEGFGQ
ncbi:hypothetical protein DNTS_005968 [Danionella cerebrum]|uniref:Uncharacterized protein n=1 Tax=Danionella cerebrum TaxID=2873325 RepID=A0A553QCD9_9TELE|nr:hypothetical protein DNTS_005968 [Danionella translucida]